MKFEEETLGMALEILYIILEKGSITPKDHPREYLWYEQQAEVREALDFCAKKQKLLLCRYKDALYLSPGVNNPVFGLSNAEIRSALGSGFNNPEMYTAFFIIHVLITEFYRESAHDAYLEKVSKKQLLGVVDKKMKAMGRLEDLEDKSERYHFNFRVISDLWSRLPEVEFRKDSPDEIKKRGVGSKVTMINRTTEFMEKNQLVKEHDDAIYLTLRCKAIISEIYSNQDVQEELRIFIEGLAEEGVEEDA